MPAHSTTAPPPPLTLNLAPGQGFWLCLAPGSTLRTTRGEVTVRWGPHTCGQALHAPSPTALQTGEQLPWSGQARACWLQLYNPWPRNAEVQLMEAAPAPGRWQRVWRRLHAALQSTRGTTQNSGGGGALHVVR